VLIDELRRSEIAIETAAANEQHYEVPAPFFERVLGSPTSGSSPARTTSARPRPGTAA
jgi:cyclopropane-fatty-acyl-phospholipid synthase